MVGYALILVGSAAWVFGCELLIVWREVLLQSYGPQPRSEGWVLF